MYYFENFPKIKYDVKKNNQYETITDISRRFKIIEAIRNRIAIYYDYTIKEGERADTIAYFYYGDSSLDWIIYIVNNIIDPQWDWPLDYLNFQNYIRKKYGSVSTAKATVHHYEKILNTQSVLYDGTIIPERIVEVDSDTYDSLPVASRRSVTSYEYEDKVNTDKRQIRLMDERYVATIVKETEEIFR